LLSRLGSFHALTVRSKKWAGWDFGAPEPKLAHFFTFCIGFQSPVTFYLRLAWRWLIYEKCCILCELSENQHRGTQEMTRTPYFYLCGQGSKMGSQSNIGLVPKNINIWAVNYEFELRNSCIWSQSPKR